MEIIKRDGRKVEFDQSKITGAIFKAIVAVGGNDMDLAEKLSEKVVKTVKNEMDDTPTVESVQDIVERILIEEGEAKIAKAYILYRNERTRLREIKKAIPNHVRNLAKESKKYFRNPLSEFVYYRSYSRWIESENRRETWIETVDRYISFMKERLEDKLTEDEYEELRVAILNQRAMPSMRLVWSAGKAARASNVSAYNCSYIAPSKLEDFAEIMYLSMCGCGVGFSVESQTVQQLPIIKRQSGEKLLVHTINDDKEGWCDALTLGLKTWYDGKDVEFDYARIRPAGSRLRTMGGMSSGPGPLKALLDFARRKILSKQGKRLTNLEVHDVICKIGEVVVMGGVRRTALISLSDLDDEGLRNAKTGQFYMTEPQRSMANNSAVYLEKPSATEFLDEWISLMKSGSGERGIFNRGYLDKQIPERRWNKMGHHAETTGTNPCGEIILRSKQFCNLSEVVCRSDDTEETLLKKVRLATILGTYQSMLTDFPYLSKDWKKNCEEERLLGVSLTGQWDCPAVRVPGTLKKLKEEAVKINVEYAKKFGINPSTSITCVKPSGTVSQLVDSSSGMHPRHSKYYIRRVRIAAHDPLFRMLKDQKIPFKPEVSQSMLNASTYVIEFPIKAPEGAVLKDDVSALEQLDHWKMVKENYCEHNPSVTISIGSDEWLESANWVYRNWEMIGGLAFLPRDDTVYDLAPYEEISEEQYQDLISMMPHMEFANILLYENQDTTQGAKELACTGGICEFIPEGVNVEVTTSQ